MAVTRIVMVTKATPYEALLASFGTHGQAAFVLSSRGESIDTYRVQHDQYRAALQQVERDLPKDIVHTLVERADLPWMLFRPNDLVVAIGPDGLFANLAKYLKGQPVVGVNPLPGEIDGVLMRLSPAEAGAQISNLVALSSVNDLRTYCDEIVLAEATTEEGGRLLAVNDFLVGRLDHISARYRIASVAPLREERQSSSGVLISTGLGSSGWMRSVRTAISGASKRADMAHFPTDPAWDEERLVFAVREPFPTAATRTDILYGNITPGYPLEIVSEMPEGGVIFSDGVPEDSLALSAGTKLMINVAKERAYLVQ